MINLTNFPSFDRHRLANSSSPYSHNPYRWIASQNNTDLWIDGVQDYIKYAKALESEFSTVLNSKPPPSFFPPPPSSTTAPFTSGFNFAAPPPQQQQNGSGVFNVASTGTLNTASFSNAATAGTNNTQADNKDDDDDEQQQEEPALQVQPTNAEVLGRFRAKLMSQSIKDKKWKDRGLGTLTLRKATDPEASKSPYLVFTTDSGRVLVNAPLVKGIRPTLMTKQPSSVIMCLFNAIKEGEEDEEEEGGGGEMKNSGKLFLFKVDSPVNATEFTELINKHVSALGAF